MANHNPTQRWTFHPFEVALVGYRNSGKTTLAARLVQALGLSIGYIKRDSHGFTMDHSGKDTAILTAAGAVSIFISDAEHHAFIAQRPADSPLVGLNFLEADAVIVEGHKTSQVPKIVVLDQDLTIVSDPTWTTQSPIAAVGPWPSAPPLPWVVPYFSRDDLEGITAFIKGRWEVAVDQTPIYGLVLTGGRSVRMGEDKAELDYGRGPQVRRTYDLLSAVCDQVYVSCRFDQQTLGARSGLPQIVDQFTGFGPLSGILSALTFQPNAAWLVVACDLPYLDSDILELLKVGRNPYRFATAFSSSDGWPEPLCTLYEPKSLPRLLQFLAAGHDCPRKMLINSPVKLLDSLGPSRIKNVNTPQERQEALHDFSF